MLIRYYRTLRRSRPKPGFSPDLAVLLFVIYGVIILIVLGVLP